MSPQELSATLSGCLDAGYSAGPITHGELRTASPVAAFVRGREVFDAVAATEHARLHVVCYRWIGRVIERPSAEPTTHGCGADLCGCFRVRTAARLTPV